MMEIAREKRIEFEMKMIVEMLREKPWVWIEKRGSANCER